MSNQYQVNQVNPAAPSNEIGLAAKRGGLVSYDAMTADVQLPETAAYFHVGDGGDLIVEDLEGNPHPIFGLLDGDYFIAPSNKVLYQAIISGVPRTTTATQITWHGGQ